MGCKEQVLIDDIIHEQVRGNHRNLSEAWMDLKKAYDSVYKKWQVAALQLIKTPKWIVRYVEQAGSKWRTSINLQVNRKTHTSSEVPIEKGIFQGDTLIPLLFVVSIITVSLLINRMNLGYMFGAPKQRKLDKMITHLLFMDDMKIYTTSKQSLVKVFNRAAEIFQSMGLFVGPDKCAVQHFVHGKKSLMDSQSCFKAVKLYSTWNTARDTRI